MNLDYNDKEKGKTPMRRSAEEIYEVVKKMRIRNERRAAELLKDLCVSAVTDMLKKGELVATVEIEDDHFEGISSVVEQLRELGYRHCLIETQDEEGEILGHSLRISLEHLGK